MPIRLKDYARQLETALKLPAGYTVKWDSETDNLIVQNETRGFVITRLCYSTWPLERVLADAKTAVAELIAGMETCSVGTFYPVAELWHPDRGNGPTTFDHLSFDSPGSISLDGTVGPWDDAKRRRP